MKQTQHQPAKKFNFRLFLYLIRALFPKWNFFDQIAYIFEVEFKIPSSTHWTRVQMNSTHQPFGLIFNAEHNHRLALVGTVEHFVSDINNRQQDHNQVSYEDLQSLTSFKILTSFLFYQINQNKFLSNSFQFRILACGPTEEIEIFISEWLSK